MAVLENSRVVNFEVLADPIGQFVDVKITEVYTNFTTWWTGSYRKDMGLRVQHSSWNDGKLNAEDEASGDIYALVR